MRLALALALALAPAACGAPYDDPAPPAQGTSTRGAVSFRWRSLDGALHRGSNTLYVEAWDAARVPADLVRVDALMPAHTHPSSTARVVRDGPGWRAEALVLGMPGAWTVALRFATRDGFDVAEVTADVP